MLRKSMLMVLAAVMCLALLAACGSNAGGNAGGESSGGAAEAPTPTTEAPGSDGAEETSAPSEVTIEHPLGSTTVPTNPEKVVVFDFATLDTLDKLGIDVIALPKSNIPAYLAEKFSADQYENAGTLFEPDFEKISALKPDVIFIAGRTSEAYDELNKIAPTIQMSLDYANYTASFENNVQIIGQIFNKEAEVAQELEAIRASAAELKGKAEAAGKALILLTTGGKISAYGPGSRFGIIHEGFGFVPMDDTIEVSQHGQVVSNEYIAERNPDIIFVIDRDAATGAEGATPAKEVVENELVKGTNAYKNGKIIYLDPGFWYLSGGGLVSEAGMVEEAMQAVE